MLTRHLSRAERYERGRRYLDASKLATGCEWCGEMDLAVLDFHHLHDKSFNLSGSACAKPVERLESEVAKCVVLCANDHRRAHAGAIVIEEDESTGKPCYYAVGYHLRPGGDEAS